MRRLGGERATTTAVPTRLEILSAFAEISDDRAAKLKSGLSI